MLCLSQIRTRKFQRMLSIGVSAQGFFLSLLLAVSASAAEKSIKLRNETITTRPVDRQGFQALAQDPDRSGLYLLQLEDAPPVDWKEQLAAQGLEVVRYIPDDAYVINARNPHSGRIKRLPFVRYFAKYKPEHKVHQKLKASVDEPEATPELTLLFSASATPGEIALAHRQFENVGRSHKSGVGHILQGRAKKGKLKELLASEAVVWIEPAPTPKLYDAVAAQIVAGEGPDNKTTTLDLGFTGKGVTVAVADSGLGCGEGFPVHPDLAGRVTGYFYYGNLTDASDEHSHGTHVTGIIAGNGATGEMDEQGFLYGLGIAPGANVIGQRLFDGLGGYEPPPSFAHMTTDAVRLGAEIGSNSWGDDTHGRYDISAMEFDALVRDADPETPGDQQYILEFSAGNAGPGARTIGSPAVGKNVIATGASQNNRPEFIIYAEGQETMADFSSRGPCEDGRIKPDVVAPGTWIASLQSSCASDENAWSPISPNYQYQGGTSQAGPQVSGAAAVFVQYFRETQNRGTPSPALVKAALINSAVDMDVSGWTGPVPNNDEGWGRVDLTQIIGSPRRYHYIDQSQPLAQAQIFEQRVVVSSGEEPLKVTLTYTDVPALPSAIPALVNDLDLELVGPEGAVYRGNQFINGQSIANAPGSDAINNVEGIHLSLPVPGEYVVRVRGSRVVEDSRRDTAAVDQDFALVISGDLPLPGQGVIVLDRRAYGAPAEMNIKLIDFDLRNQPNAQVSIQSTTETTPVPLVLQPSGAFGVFTGKLATATGPALADEKLQIAHGDLITVKYNDADPAGEVVATVRGDLLPPVISDVSTTNRFGKQMVTWRTDERSTGTVFYRNGGGFLAASNELFSTSQEIILSGLTEGVTYSFYVVSTDEAGNKSTNNNNGSNFTFVAQPASTVLLVDAYTHSPESESEIIPVTEYTVALDRTGVTYEVWDVATLGSPTAADLAPFRVVMWRINDSFYDAQNTISQPEQTAIQQYLDRGGSFFISSMEILSRVGDSPFRTNVLQTAEFITPADPFGDCADCHEDHGAEAIVGSDLESLTAGIEITLDYSRYPIFDFGGVIPNIGPDLGDIISPTTNAVPILFENMDGEPVGIRSPRTGMDSNGRVVFFSFPLDAVPLDGPAPNNRVNLLRNALSFLAPGVNGLSSISLDSPSYTVPSKVTVEVADSDLVGKPAATVKFSTDTFPGGVTVQLAPTVVPGLFRGFVTLVPANAAAEPGKLRAANGDLVVAEYVDASASSTLRAAAEVDTASPLITDLVVEPDYEAAIIRWNTSEGADALVQFGESTFLGKTAYHPGEKLSHMLILPALLPDRLYYYQVVSRDPAGNATVDDNNGQLYTFRTLKPLTPPWTDNLESSTTGWSVQDGEDTESSWTWGTPNNGMTTQAHSGTKAWGTNLDGDQVTYVQTFLISPAVELLGGNYAKLSFWHNYDFLGESTFEMGQLLLFTNSQMQPIVLKSYGDFTTGWELEEFDLTPYLGRVVQVVWQYELFDLSFENNPHPGWLLDDISVTVTNISRGRIEVTNNLAQAYFYVDGPTTFEAGGRTYTNLTALSGEYVIEWEDIPYYQTPAPQTNILSANGTLRFEGKYTFPDANSNGISDLWEQQYFGGVTPAVTPISDSDNDGLSDYCEFVAGTNPVDPASYFAVTPPLNLGSNRVRMTWYSTPGRVYRVFASTNAVDWVPFSSWITASQGTTTSYSPPQLDAQKAWLFKVEVVP